MKYLAIFSLAVIPFISFSQISKNVSNQLPDSLKPADINKISYPEAKKILSNIGLIEFEKQNENNEIEQLCIKFTPLITNSKTNNEKLEHLITVSRYWLSRYSSRDNDIYAKQYMLDSSNVYIELFRTHVERHSKQYKSNLTKYHVMKGLILIKKKNYAEGYSYIRNALATYKIDKNSERIGFLYRVLAHMYFELELYNQSIVYCDSVLTLYALSENTIIKSQDQSATLTEKAYSFCNLYVATSREYYKDSLISNVKKLASSTKAPKYKSIAFDILARMTYHQGNYTGSIALTDSSIALSNGKEPNNGQIHNLIFKALSLIKLGKRNEGISLIKGSKIQGDIPEAGKILDELYKFEKERGNLKHAIGYLERFKKFQDSNKSLRSRGQIFEIQQKYDVASRDLYIQQLREKGKRKKLIAGGIGLVIFFVAFQLAVRFRNNQKKTRILIDQINELTELQIQRIEDEKDKERRRIGQELHDDLSGSIAASIRYLRMMAEDETKSEYKIGLSAISNMLETGYDKARSKSHELYMEETDENFWKGLAQNIDLFLATTNIKFSLSRETSDLILTPEEKTTVLLIIRESITNIIKHSKASEVEILIYSEFEKLILEISDNGKGMSLKFDSKNIGLKSINDRVSKLNGALTIRGRNTAGITLTVEIPVIKQL